MVQFIEKHRRLLQAYCLIARILGWLLILGGVLWFFVLEKTLGNIMGTMGGQQQIDIVLYCAHSFAYDFFIPGFLAFAIGGLLDYLLRPKARPPLILRITDKLCYFYAVFLIIKFSVAIMDLSAGFWFVNFTLFSPPAMSETARILLVQPLLGPTLAKVLLLIGVGMILHRLLPVIEEWKTLV
jgi:hypothetical protein